MYVNGFEVNRSRIGSQRQPIKKTKESNFNRRHKEIIKLNYSSKKLNAKRNLILRHFDLYTLRKVFNKSFVLDKTCREIEDEIFFYQYLSEDSGELIIENDKDFKMIARLKSQKLKVGFNVDEKFKAVKQSDNDSSTEVDLDSKIIRIECKYVESPDISEVDVNGRVQKEELKSEHSDECDHASAVDDLDLENLLVMMALSSKPELDGVGIKLLNNENKKQNQFAKDFVPLEPSNICNEIGNVLKIVPFRLEMNNRKMYLSMKYVRKWKTYVKRKQDFFVEQRKKTLNTFFEKLEKKKSNINQAKEYTSRAKSQVKDYKTYQQRYKVQKHIIALQKAKLEEQNRIIEELKYNKILEASRQSVDEMREEVRKSYFEIDRPLKPKIKCLTNELKIPEVDESSLVLHCLKVPQFLQRMEKRAREREEKHAMIRERRKQMEEDRIRLKQQEELSKAEMDKEEKLRRITELREKRKKDKIESIRRKQYTERMRALRVMADLHYERYLMVNYAIRPLKKLLEIKRHNVEMAESHYNFQLKKNVFLNFMWYTEDMVFERNYVAQNFYRKKVLRKYFEGFKKNHYEFVLKMQVAEDYYDYYVTNFMFRKFKEGINVLRKEFEIKVQRADAYYESNLLFKTFTCWRTLPALNALKREQEARKAKWRQKVLQVVPDYTPPED